MSVYSPTKEIQQSSESRPRQYHEVFLRSKANESGETYQQTKYRRTAISKRWASNTKRADYGLEENPNRIIQKDDPDYVNPPRECLCGTTKFNMGSVSVVADGELGHFSHITRCGSVWSCPICAEIIRRKRAREITEAIEKHTASGGGLALMTETIQHSKDDSLAYLLGILKDAHNGMNKSRAFAKIKDKYSVDGYIVSLETPWSYRNGWHPHQHFLLFLDKPITDIEAESMTAEVVPLWSKQVEKKGGYASWERGLDIQAVNNEKAAGSYIAKAAYEMTNATDAKEGSGSITPFQLLDNPTRENELLFREYAKATKGRSAIRWSKGLRTKLGIVKKSDKELAEETPEGTEVANIAKDVWNTVLKNNIELQEQVKHLILEGEFQKVAQILDCDVDYRLIIDDENNPQFIPMFRFRHK